MLIDFRVLTLNDDDDFTRSFELLSINKDESFGRAYYEHYNFLAQLEGSWYSILPISSVEDDYDEYIFKMNEFCDVLFDYKNPCIYPVWANSHMLEYSLAPLIISSKYSNSFFNIIHYILQKCSTNTIAFLSRFSEYESEIIGGTITFKRFMKMIEHQQLLCGMCYIITL